MTIGVRSLVLGTAAALTSAAAYPQSPQVDLGEAAPIEEAAEVFDQAPILLAPEKPEVIEAPDPRAQTKPKAAAAPQKRFILVRDTAIMADLAVLSKTAKSPAEINEGLAEIMDQYEIDSKAATVNDRLKTAAEAVGLSDRAIEELAIGEEETNPTDSLQSIIDRVNLKNKKDPSEFAKLPADKRLQAEINEIAKRSNVQIPQGGPFTAQILNLAQALENRFARIEGRKANSVMDIYRRTPQRYNGILRATQAMRELFNGKNPNIVMFDDPLRVNIHDPIPFTPGPERSRTGDEQVMNAAAEALYQERDYLYLRAIDPNK